MSKKDFDVQCTAKVCCTHKKKEDPSGKESSFKVSITFGISLTFPNVIEKAIKVFTLIFDSIIAQMRYKFK